MAIPGVGPLVAAGWLATTLAGAATGAAAGGIVGALVKSGVPHEEAEVYEEGVRRGSTLVSVQAEDVDVPKIEAILDRRTTADWRIRREQYTTSGWHPTAR
jgi:outer membrane lipoprotein SlyB